MKYFNLHIDFKNRTNNNPVIFRVGERGSGGFTLKLTDDGSPVDLTGLSFAFAMNTPSPYQGAIYDETASSFKLIEAKNGLFQYTITPEALKNAGLVRNAHFVLKKDGELWGEYVDFEFVILPDLQLDYPAAYYFSETEELLAYLKALIEDGKEDLIENLKDITDLYEALNEQFNSANVVKKSGDKMTGKLDIQNDVGLQLLFSTGLPYMRFLTSNNIDYFQHSNPLTISGINSAKGKGVNFNEEFVKINGVDITVYKKVIMNVPDLFNAEKIYLFNLAANEEFVSVKLTFVRYDKATWTQLTYGWNRHIIDADDVDIAGANANHQCGMPDGSYKYAAVSKTQVAGHLYNYDVTYGYALRNVTVYYRKK